MAFRILYFALLLTMQYLFQDRHDFGVFFGLYALLFGLYALLVIKGRPSRYESFWLVLFGAVFFLRDPVLSDDVYRFIWDGQLVVRGQNPYLFLPEAHPELDFVHVLGLMNSGEYFSVYPPLNQLCFMLAAYFAKGDIEWNIFVLRLILFLGYLFTAWVLDAILRRQLANETQRFRHFALFAFNPLILIESLGSLHFEVLLAGLTLAAYFVYRYKNSWFWASVLFGLAVSIKLLPLVFLPLIAKHLGWKKAGPFVFVAFLMNLILFVPFMEGGGGLAHIFSSIQLYFQSFEFNSSLYYLFRAMGHWLFGFNIIAYLGPVLGFVNLALILLISWKVKSFEKAAVFILFCYLLLSTTVHPWYLVPLLCFSALHTFRFSFLWSFTVGLSYIAYRNEQVEESFSLIFLEYFFVVLMALYEAIEERKTGLG